MTSGSDPLPNPGYCGVCGVIYHGGTRLLAVFMHADGKPVALCYRCWKKAGKPMHPGPINVVRCKGD